MKLRLRDDLSFCRAGGQLIFLDIREDRYFRLPERLQSCFLAFVGGSIDTCGELGELLRHGILTSAPPSDRCEPVPAIAAPNRSALEDGAGAGRVGMRLLMEVNAIVYWTRHVLRTRSLKHNIDDLILCRQRATGPGNFIGFDQAQRNAASAAAQFRRARLYVPIGTSCLLDSMSMLRFLARRRLRAHMVFGVTPSPFGAHCWVQAGDVVLNDTLGNVLAHTPIHLV